MKVCSSWLRSSHLSDLRLVYHKEQMGLTDECVPAQHSN